MIWDMGLQEQVNDDLKDAMRSKDENRINALRLLKAAFANVEYARTDSKNPDFQKPVTEGDLLRVVENQIKQRRESIEMYTKGNRPELAARNRRKLTRCQNTCRSR